MFCKVEYLFQIFLFVKFRSTYVTYIDERQSKYNILPTEEIKFARDLCHILARPLQEQYIRPVQILQFNSISVSDAHDNWQ